MFKGRRPYLWNNILDRLEKAYGSSLAYLVDIRYLGRWLKEFPSCFPKFMIEGNYTAVFNPEQYRWEIYKGLHTIEFNPKDWL